MAKCIDIMTYPAWVVGIDQLYVFVAMVDHIQNLRCYVVKNVKWTSELAKDSSILSNIELGTSPSHNAGYADAKHKVVLRHWHMYFISIPIAYLDYIFTCFFVSTTIWYYLMHTGGPVWVSGWLFSSCTCSAISLHWGSSLLVFVSLIAIFLQLVI